MTVQGGQAGRPNLKKAISVFRISFPFKLGIRDTKHAGLGKWMSSNDAALKAPYGLVPVSGQPLWQGGCGQGRQYPGPGACAKGSLPTLAGHLSWMVATWVAGEIISSDYSFQKLGCEGKRINKTMGLIRS